MFDRNRMSDVVRGTAKSTSGATPTAASRPTSVTSSVDAAVTAVSSAGAADVGAAPSGGGGESTTIVKEASTSPLTVSTTLDVDADDAAGADAAAAPLSPKK